MGNRRLRLLIPYTLLLSLSALLQAAPAAAVSGNAPGPFGYEPAAAPAPAQTKTIAVDYSDAELVNDPVQGVFLVSKNRWKNWISRSVYIMLLYLALMVISFSLPRTQEHNLIVLYMISGLNACLSFWVFLCACLIFTLRSSAWLAILPASLAMAAGAYFSLIKVKNSDVSLEELKKSFQKMSALAQEDDRLSSLEGTPGNWPEEDFIRQDLPGAAGRRAP